jgi:hypothetical protein
LSSSLVLAFIRRGKEFVGQVRKAVEPAVEAAKMLLEKVKESTPDGVEVKVRRESHEPEALVMHPSTARSCRSRPTMRS